MEDILRSLGHLTLGSRLKRLGERLQAQTQALLDAAEIAVSASSCPLLAALERFGPLSVGALAETLGVSQPGVTRALGQLEGQGLVRPAASATDRRLRTTVLTPAGRRVVAAARRTAWPLVEAAVADACARPPASLLAQLDALEDALAEASLGTRATRLHEDPPRRITPRKRSS